MRHGGAGSCWLDHAHHRQPWWGCVGRTSRSVPVPRWSRGGHHQHHHQNPPRSRRQWGWVWRGYCLDFGVGTWLDGRGGERCGLEPRGALVCGREGGSEGVSVRGCEVNAWVCERRRLVIIFAECAFYYRTSYAMYCFCWLSGLTWVAWAYIAAYGKCALIRICDQSPLVCEGEYECEGGSVCMYVCAAACDARVCVDINNNIRENMQNSYDKMFRLQEK